MNRVAKGGDDRLAVPAECLLLVVVLEVERELIDPERFEFLQALDLM